MVHGYSRSSMLTPFKSSSQCLLWQNSMSVPILICFHARRANTGKITTFYAFTLTYAGILEPRRLALGLLKISYAGCLGLSLAISSQFTLEMCAAVKSCEKFTKTPILEAPGCSRSVMLINLKSSSPVLVMISSMCVSICNRFHAGKITSLGGCHIWRPRSSGTPSSRNTKICHDKLESLGHPTMKILWF